MAGKKLRNIREYLFRNGRYLDVARWNYHFEDGKESEVLKALATYQNMDGGFGHGLEPDVQNPNSNPMATWMAIQVLRELKFPKLSHNMIEKILDYLLISLDRENQIWNALIPSNNEYPHSPWYHYISQNTFGYNPTAEFVGFILRFADDKSEIYENAVEVLNSMIPIITEENYEIEVHELVNVLNLYRDLKAANKTDLLPNDFESFLKDKVDSSISRSTSDYMESNYYTPPSMYIADKNDFTYIGNEDICGFYTDYIEESVTDYGFWQINWDWQEEEMPENVVRDWAGILTVNNMLFIEKIVK